MARAERIGQLRGPFFAILNHRIHLRELLHQITRRERFTVPALLKNGKHARGGALLPPPGFAGAQQLGAIDVDSDETRGILRHPIRPHQSLKRVFATCACGRCKAPPIKMVYKARSFPGSLASTPTDRHG
jgi:hypothetical protein